jgi:protein arginine kinase activator
MDCDLCRENEATNHIQMVIDGNKKSLHLCAQCASKKKVSPNMFEGIALAELLYNFADMTKEASPEPPEPPEPLTEMTCPSCEWTSAEFQKTGLLGCGDCYEVFKPFLLEALPSLHKGVNHVGKMIEPVEGGVRTVAPPSTAADNVAKRLQHLQAALKEAVTREQYETAAALRDEINALTDAKTENEGDFLLT